MAKKNEVKDEPGTDLVVVDFSKYPALNPESELAEAIAANTQGETIDESMLVRVPTPAGGAKKWTVPTITGEEMADELTGILVYVGRRGVLWPTEDVGDNRPLLVTDDLITARRVGDDYGDIDPDVLEKYRTNPGEEPARYNWQALPWCEFGTGKGGHGKRAKESRLLFLLREGEPWPLLIRAQPGSLKTVRPFILRLPVPHWRAVVALSLQVAESSGKIKYSQIVPRLVGTINRELGLRVKETYTDSLARMVASDVLDSDREE